MNTKYEQNEAMEMRLLNEDELDKIIGGTYDDPSEWEFLHDDTPMEFKYNIGDVIRFGAGWEGTIVGYHPGGYVVELISPHRGSHTCVKPNSVICKL